MSDNTREDKEAKAKERERTRWKKAAEHWIDIAFEETSHDDCLQKLHFGFTALANQSMNDLFRMRAAVAESKQRIVTPDTKFPFHNGGKGSS